MRPIDILTGEIAIEVTGVVGVSPALWYFRYIASIFLTTQAPVCQMTIMNVQLCIAVTYFYDYFEAKLVPNII